MLWMLEDNKGSEMEQGIEFGCWKRGQSGKGGSNKVLVQESVLY